MNEDLAEAARLNRMKLEIERLKLANAKGVKVKTVTDAMVCKWRHGEVVPLVCNVRYVLAK